PVDGGVLAVDVVAHLGLGHRPAHRRGGSRHRVGAQVYVARHAAPAAATASTGPAAAPGAHGATSASHAVNAARPRSYISSRRSFHEEPLRFSTSGTRPQFAFMGWKPSGFAEER